VKYFNSHLLIHPDLNSEVSYKIAALDLALPSEDYFQKMSVNCRKGIAAKNFMSISCSFQSN
jgi:hypothetical protein